MKFIIRIPIKQPKKRFTIDVSFKTKSKMTERTMKVAEAFGIGIDEERDFPVFKNYEVDIKPRDVVYITGDSGSGKSTLVKKLALALAKSREFGSVLLADQFPIPEDLPLVDAIGKDIEEALRCLSLAGLNEAFLFLRKYHELSDGQKYRFKIACMLYQNPDVWVFDEFCSVLDRETAKIVAYCVQKVARREGKTVLAATSHRDLIEDFKPSVFIEKGIGSDCKTSYHLSFDDGCSVLKEVRILKGSKEDYHDLEQFHYRAGPPAVCIVFKAILNDKTIGVITYSSPLLRAAGRRQYMGCTLSPKELRSWKVINRVIIHPKYRSIGLGANLVRETLPLCGATHVEAMAVMARYNPFFEKAGMQRICFERKNPVKRDILILERAGFDPQLLSSVHYNLSRLKGMDPAAKERLKAELVKYSGLFLRGSRRGRFDSNMIRQALEDDLKLAEGIKRIAQISAEKNYYIWLNPGKVQGLGNCL